MSQSFKMTISDYILYKEQKQFPLSFTPIKNNKYDSDHESIETNDSLQDIPPQILWPIQKQLIKFIKAQPEIDVQPKRKLFNTIQQKQKYIEDYQRKYKTEVCKNWQIKGTCPYGDKCCFAHGYNELNSKMIQKQTYKTKPCKKFFEEGYCPYGYRCQYLHSDIKYLPQFSEDPQISESLKKSMNNQETRKYNNKLNSLNSFEMLQKSQNRLQIFSSLEE